MFSTTQTDRYSNGNIPNPSSSISYNLCLICYKETTNLDNSTSILFNNFLKFLVRFLGKVGINLLHFVKTNGNIVCCEVCKVLVTSFNKLYDQFECLKLELEWELEKLVKIMKLASRVPSRVQELKRRLEETYKKHSVDNSQGEMMEKTLICFRTDLITACSRRLARSLPKVLMDRHRMIKEEKVDPVAFQSFCYTGSEVANFLGWMMSCAAVVMLATTCASDCFEIRTGENSFSKLVSFKDLKISDECDLLVEKGCVEDAVGKQTERAVDLNCVTITEISIVRSDLIQQKRSDCSNGANVCAPSSPVTTKTEAFNENGFDQGQMKMSEDDAFTSSMENHELKLEAFSTETDTECTKHQALPPPISSEVLEKKSKVKNNESLHFAQETASESKQLFLCPACHKCLQNKSSFNYHFRLKHSNEPKKYRCDLCKLSYFSYNHYRSHKLSKTHLMKKTFLRKQQLRKLEVGGDIAPADDNETNLSTSICSSKEAKYMKSSGTKTVAMDSSMVQNLEGPRRYNLRERRKSFCKEANESENDGKSEFSSTNSFIQSSDNDSSTESTDGDDVAQSKSHHEHWKRDNTDDVKATQIAVQSPGHSGYKYLYCRLEGCRKIFRGKQAHDEHKKLHVRGNYKCNFCKVVETSVLRLSEHERKHHRTNRSEQHDKEIFYCPRCPFETAMSWVYKHHFAQAHISGFEQLQRFRRNVTESVECDICKQRVRKSNLDSHFKSLHDLTGVCDQQVVRCSVSGCSAYFAKRRCNRRNVLPDHIRTVHGHVNAPINMGGDEDGADDFYDDVIEDKDQFKCRLCNKTFLKLYNLKQHLKIYHKRQEKIPSKSLICPVRHCTIKLKTQEDLHNHKLLHGSFKCELCNVVKEYAPDLALHETEHFMKSDDLKSKRKSWDKGKQSLKCSRCPSTFRIKGLFLKHFLTNHLMLSGGGHFCSICQIEGTGTHKHFHNIEGLNPSDIHKCDECSAYFVKAKQLIFHKLTIHCNGKCPKCGKSFGAIYMLRDHIVRVHPQLEIFPTNVIFPCVVDDCRRVFTTKVQLDNHKINHSSKEEAGMSSARCSKCDKQFRGQTALKIHMYNTHKCHADVSFICSECGKAFRTKLGLKTHELYHKGPNSWKFQCSTCGRKFAAKQKLQQHFRTHTKEKPFICQHCGEKYAHRHNWRNHVKMKHQEEYHNEEPGGGRNAGATMLSRKGSKKGECILSGVQQK